MLFYILFHIIIAVLGEDEDGSSSESSEDDLADELNDHARGVIAAASLPVEQDHYNNIALAEILPPMLLL